MKGIKHTPVEMVIEKAIEDQIFAMRLAATKRQQGASVERLGILVAHTVTVLGLDWNSSFNVDDGGVKELVSLEKNLKEFQSCASEKPLHNTNWPSLLGLATVKQMDPEVPLASRHLSLWLSARSPQTPKTILDFAQMLPQCDYIEVPDATPKFEARSARSFLERLFEFYPEVTFSKDKRTLHIDPKVPEDVFKTDLEGFEDYFVRHGMPGPGIYNRNKHIVHFGTTTDDRNPKLIGFKKDGTGVFATNKDAPTTGDFLPSACLNLNGWDGLLHYHQKDRSRPRERQPRKKPSLFEYWVAQDEDTRGKSELFETSRKTLKELASIDTLVNDHQQLSSPHLNAERVNLWLSSKLKQTPALIADLYRHLNWLPLNRSTKLNIDFKPSNVNEPSDVSFCGLSSVPAVLLRMLQQSPVMQTSVTSGKEEYCITFEPDHSSSWEFIDENSRDEILSQVRAYAEQINGRKGESRDKKLVSKWQI